MASQHTDADNNALERFLAYPFETDETYQQGLAGILNGSSFVEQSEGDKEDLLLRSRVFYFNRVAGSLLDVDDVRKHIQNANLTSHPIVLPSEPSTAAPNAAEESRVLSFAELKELIEQGKTDQIPNNRVIPNELSNEPPSVSASSVRKKPWEK